MARKKIREYDSKRLLKEHLKRLANINLQIRSAKVSLPHEYSIALFSSNLIFDDYYVCNQLRNIEVETVFFFFSCR